MVRRGIVIEEYDDVIQEQDKDAEKNETAENPVNDLSGGNTVPESF